ncbi:hypothetical protein [Neptuniibacter sp. QD37_11]|uniref:hypothetical protein n=1 Tax=Neptuniibacter sp. QD37_11 TaxID=3398209 RepID=UPI0039F4F726
MLQTSAAKQAVEDTPLSTVEGEKPLLRMDKQLKRFVSQEDIVGGVLQPVRKSAATKDAPAKSVNQKAPTSETLPPEKKGAVCYFKTAGRWSKIGAKLVRTKRRIMDLICLQNPEVNGHVTLPINVVLDMLDCMEDQQQCLDALQELAKSNHEPPIASSSMPANEDQVASILTNIFMNSLDKEEVDINLALTMLRQHWKCIPDNNRNEICTAIVDEIRKENEHSAYIEDWLDLLSQEKIREADQTATA